MKGAFEALAKAAASFCGDSSALATTPSKRMPREVARATLVFGAMFEATLLGATACVAGFSRAILPSCAKFAAACAQPASHWLSSEACDFCAESRGAHELARLRRESASAAFGRSRLCGRLLEAAVSEVPSE